MVYYFLNSQAKDVFAVNNYRNGSFKTLQLYMGDPRTKKAFRHLDIWYDGDSGAGVDSKIVVSYRIGKTGSFTTLLTISGTDIGNSFATVRFPHNVQGKFVQLDFVIQMDDGDSSTFTRIHGYRVYWEDMEHREK